MPANTLQALPRAKHKQPEWQIAAEMLFGGGT
jgi:hypothetical protein